MTVPVQYLMDEIFRRSDGRLTSTPLARAETKSVTRFATLEHAGESHVAFLAQAKYRDAAKASKAGVLVLTQKDVEAMWPEGVPADRALIVTANPYAWFAWALQVFTAGKKPAGRIDPKATVEEGAVVDPTAVVEAAYPAFPRCLRRSRYDGG